MGKDLKYIFRIDFLVGCLEFDKLYFCADIRELEEFIHNTNDRLDELKDLLEDNFEDIVRYTTEREKEILREVLSKLVEVCKEARDKLSEVTEEMDTPQGGNMRKWVSVWDSCDYILALIQPPKPQQISPELATAEANTQEPQQKQTKKTRGRGRPKETLKDKMIDDADGSKLQKIHTKIDGKKGKDIALIILACIKKGWMTKPTYTQVKNEFGDIGSKTGYNKYLNEQMFTKEELEGAINSLN